MISNGSEQVEILQKAEKQQVDISEDEPNGGQTQ